MLKVKQLLRQPVQPKRYGLVQHLWPIVVHDMAASAVGRVATIGAWTHATTPPIR